MCLALSLPSLSNDQQPPPLSHPPPLFYLDKSVMEQTQFLSKAHLRESLKLQFLLLNYLHPQEWGTPHSVCIAVRMCIAVHICFAVLIPLFWRLGHNTVPTHSILPYIFTHQIFLGAFVKEGSIFLWKVSQVTLYFLMQSGF